MTTDTPFPGFLSVDPLVFPIDKLSPPPLLKGVALYPSLGIPASCYVDEERSTYPRSRNYGHPVVSLAPARR